MPKVKRSRKAPPDGWELIEPTLDELDQKMREAETEPHEGKRKVESLWPIFRIHHQKTRYIFDLFYKRKAISRELYEYCIKEGYADKNLIAKWKKQGAGSLSARTAAAGAALAEHRARTSTHPGLRAAQDSARHTTLCWEQLFLRAVPRPD
ncbi:protein BUD31 homolog isoform X1 [Muntiacus reevesi]|uniref:protein BUD31 homolog isoform X1 n=1 Tax=Muntiacus reevesi TaxID=9886 RepID=UPI0033074731